MMIRSDQNKGYYSQISHRGNIYTTYFQMSLT